MTKEAAQFAAILKGWGPSLQRAVAKANGNRWPAGAPGSKGGQFAPAKGGGTAPYSTSKLGFNPSQLSLFSGLQAGVQAPQYGIGKPLTAGPTKWKAPGSHLLEPDEPAQPKPAPPGAKPHLKTDDYGKPVTINYPTKPSDPGTWKNPEATATFTPGSPTPASLNGVAMKPWTNAPKTINEWANVDGQRPELDRDFPFDPVPGKAMGAGVIVQEPDGRIWLTKPTNHFGGYMQTFPKGTVENGLSLQASAIKEAYEETGLKVQITGVLGDYERTTSVARFYVARRVGGTPADMGWESQALRLAAPADLGKLLNMGVDKGILEDLRTEQFIKRAPLSLVRDREVIEEEVARRGLAWLYKVGAKPPRKGGGKWEQQARWPAGSPLGGQWKAMGADGLTLPPTIAGGLSGKNAAYQKKANAVHALAQANDLKSVLDYAVSYEKTAQASAAAGKKSSHVKWHAQLSQYTTQLVADMTAKPKAEAAAAKITGPEKLVAAYTKVGAKPGGSNDGAIYEDKDGTKWLVKGNNYASTGGLKMSDDRAKNEVLASKLMAAVGIPGPEIKLVDLDGQHQGNLGVAVKWIDGLQKFNPADASQLAAVQNQFAVHAWLGNWDVLGMGLDNTMFKDGKAINIDPGGSILFRAQGAPKKEGAFDAQASDWESMRSTDQHQKSVYGKMTASQLQESAKLLGNVSDEAIKKLVDAHGPGDADAKAELAGRLIARRNSIMLKAGLVVNMKLGPSLVQAEPAPAPEPPKIVDAVPPPANTAAPTGIEKPAFNSGMPSDPYYQGLADKALAMHQAGDIAGLKAMATKKNGDPAWPAKTKHGKTMSGWHSALVADLEGKQQQAAAQVSAGQATVIDAKGKAWRADKGVLNPVATPAESAGVIPKIPKDMLTTMAELYHPGPMSNSMYSAVLSALNGNEQEVKAFTPATSEETAMKDAILAAMKDQTKATSAPAQKEPPATLAKPDTIPGFSAAFAAEASGVTAPALPNFDAEKVKPDNKNASSHNPKVDHIAKLAKAGDVKSLLALSYSTNTYGKKQAKLANDALAALGSPHQVTPGQKANSHSALVNGTAQNAPVTASVQPLPKPAAPADKPKPAFKPELLTTPPSFTASGVAAVNEANNAAVKEVYNTAKTGDLHALQNLKFEQLDKATQKKTGVLLSFDQHPSKGVQEYYGVIQDEVNSQLTGKSIGPQIGPVEVSKEWQELSDAVAPVPVGAGVKAYAANTPSAERIGLYVTLGKAPAIPVVNTVNTIMGKSNWGKWAKGEYQKASQKAKSVFQHYLSSAGAGQINNALRNGDLSGTAAGLSKKDYIDTFNKELAIDIPEGAKFTRMMGTSGFGGTPMTKAQVNDMIAKIEKSGPGTVLQEPGFSSSSHGTSILGSNEIQWKFTAGQGVKAFPAWLSANVGEGECLFPPNQRYLVTGYKKEGNKFIIDALLLPTV